MSQRTTSFGKVVNKLSKGLSLDSLPSDWVKRTNEEGITFYVHKLTGVATYERPQPLPDGWRITKDKASGVVYFWNVYTRETRPCHWVAPPPPPPAGERQPSRSVSNLSEGSSPPPPPAAGDGAGSSEQHAALPVAAPPPPLSSESVRVRLSAEAFGMVRFAPLSDGRSLAVVSVVASPLTAAVREGALLLAINGAPVPPTADEATALVEAARAQSSVDIEFSQPEMPPNAASDRSSERSSGAADGGGGKKKGWPFGSKKKGERHRAADVAMDEGQELMAVSPSSPGGQASDEIKGKSTSIPLGGRIAAEL